MRVEPRAAALERRAAQAQALAAMDGRQGTARHSTHALAVDALAVSLSHPLVGPPPAVPSLSRPPRHDSRSSWSTPYSWLL